MLLSLLLSLTAAPLDADLAALRRADARLAEVAFRLQTANVALCPVVVALPGFTLQALSQYVPADRPRIARQFGLRDSPAIAAVVPGSAAARGGLRTGDSVLAVDGAAVPNASAATGYAQVAATEALVDQALTDGMVRIRTVRAGEITITGDRGCRSRIQLIDGGLQKTSSDGTYVLISQRMYEFANSDAELAIVAAHELAHNILRHAEIRIASKTAEYDADRLSVWLLARAGYDLTAIVPFWTRLGRRADYGIFSDGTHPGWGKRVARLAEAVAEVTRQRAAGAALVPPPQQSASQAKNRR